MGNGFIISAPLGTAFVMSFTILKKRVRPELDRPFLISLVLMTNYIMWCSVIFYIMY